jgi:hypothetical protein
MTNAIITALVGSLVAAGGISLGIIVADADFAPMFERIFTGALALALSYQGGCMLAVAWWEAKR